MGLERLIVKGRVNILGVVAAILNLIVPFMSGPWWILKGGSGFLEVLCSPFNISITVLGRVVEVPIIPYITLASRILIVVSSIMLLSGSLIANREFGLSLVKASYSKPLTLTVLFTITLLLVPKLVPQKLIPELASVDIEIPVVGEKTLTLKVNVGGREVLVVAPIVAKLTTWYYIVWIPSLTSLISGIIHKLVFSHIHYSRR
ncbi:MAG TPA: hypothetical protein EYH40_05690 [Desulfurococcales archaeon]|nr:hypothetical protein [Desulfurococcales archaeon]